MESRKSQVNISDEEFLKESLRIVEVAKQKGVVLRILGGFAVFIHSDHSQEARDIQHNLGRLGLGGPTFTDLDLGGYSRQWKNIKAVLEGDLKLQPDRMTNALYGNARLIFFHPVYHYPIDVFIDKLEFSQTVPFVDSNKLGRLELDYPTISLADIMLEKLQIHQLNRKDMIDLMALLRGHEVGTAQAPQVIDGNYIARMLAEEWGFWYDALNNLQLTEALASSLSKEGKIPENDLGIILSRIRSLRDHIGAPEKSKRWKVRERVGTSKPWYREVSDL